MKSFFKNIFASMVGTFIALGFLFFVVIGSLVAFSGSDGSKWDEDMGRVKDSSVLTIVFDGPVLDRMPKKDLLTALLEPHAPQEIGLYELKRSLKHAANDDKIKGLLLRFRSLRSGMANTQEVRRAIEEFKKSGKFVLAYAENYTEASYMVASVADEVILYPKGFFEWNGVFAKLSFFKNTLKKLDVIPQIVRVGKYKSAVEPFLNDKMSESSREQVNALISGVWSQILNYTSEKTKLSTEELQSLAEEMSVIYAKDAFEKGFVNLLASSEEVEQKLMELTGVEEKPHYVRWSSYLKNAVPQEKYGSSNKVAIVFANGGINSGPDEGDNITPRSLLKIMNEIRRDEDVKAVVFRVNSPGGSSLASDVIWTSTQWMKDAKPMVTSFGDVAASGGYYISAGSQYIFAEPLTLTGSIGVFSLSFATKKFWNDTVGMTFDTAKSHKFADIESLVRELNPEELMKMQSVVDTIYEDFLGVVQKGREKFATRDDVHAVAQGRVWLGLDALNQGLVDELGGMDQAVAKAAELAQIKDYDVVAYPRPKSPFEEFMMQFGDVSAKILLSIVPEGLKDIAKSKSSQSLQDQVLTRMPFDIVFE